MSLSIRAAADEVSDRAALILDGREVSYAELAAAAERIAPSLRRRSCVPVVARPTLSAVATALAAIDSGIPIVPLSANAPQAERDQLTEQARSALERESNLEPRDPPLAIVFTSGSTGSPRGVVLSRKAFMASARASEKNLGWRDGDAWLCPLSWAHIGGLSVLVRCLIGRRTSVLFSAPTDLARALRPPVTIASLVPPMLEPLVRPEASFRASGTLRAILLGGGPASPRLLEQARNRGLPVLTTYGMTETCSQVATAPLEVRSPPGAVGRPLPGIAVSVVNGEICISGPVLMSGYLKGPTLQGAFHTGDLGRLEDGWLYITGRTDDRINSGAHRVDPSQVEAVLEELDGIRSACVFGLPDPTWGHIVCAAVVLEPPLNERSASGAIRELCKRRLPSPARPRRLVVATSLPTTASGKRSRQATREAFAGKLEVLVYR